MELCYDPACTRYKKTMTPAGVQGKDGVAHKYPTCFGNEISTGLRWPVVRALIRKADNYKAKLLAGSESVRHVDKMADLLSQAQAAARDLPDLPMGKLTHNKPKEG